MAIRKKTAKKPTRLQERKKLEKSRRDERVRELKKLPLCVSIGFLEFVEQKGWNDRTTDAAALVMHRYFMGEHHHKLRDGWLSIPYQTFRAMFGKNYVGLKNRLIQDEFLEYDEEAGHRIGVYCRRFQPRRELREGGITASYLLQSNEIQILYLKYRERFRMTARKMKTFADKTAKIAFSKDASCLTPPDLRWGKENGVHPFYRLVQEGRLTETEFATIETLTRNTFELELRITEDEISDIASRQFQNPTRKGKPRKHDLPAFTQLYRSKVENTRVPSVKVKTNGRYFTPFTNLFRSLWNHVVHKGQPLVSIDIKTSHPYCLLAFVKDIGENFFGTEGTFEERLNACRFSRQIRLVPNLMLHLHRSLFFCQDQAFFEYVGRNFRKPKTVRKEAHCVFERFTRYLFDPGNRFWAGKIHWDTCTTHLSHTTTSSNPTNSDPLYHLQHSPSSLSCHPGKSVSSITSVRHLFYLISIANAAVLESQRMQP